jgi:hypothetical protein
MPRKKVTKTDNMTLTTELDDNAMDLDAMTAPIPEPTISDEREELTKADKDKPVTKLDVRKENKWLKEKGLQANFGLMGVMASCQLFDTKTGKSAMPISPLTKAPQLAFGIDKERALVNAVGMVMNNIIARSHGPGSSDISLEESLPELVPFPPPKMTAGSTLPGEWHPGKEESKFAVSLLQALRKLIREEIAESDTNLRKKLRDLLEEE